MFNMYKWVTYFLTVPCKSVSNSVLQPTYVHYLSIIEAREGDAEGPAEGLMHECIDDRVDSRVGVYQVVGNSEKNVVALQGKFREAMRELLYAATKGLAGRGLTFNCVKKYT